MGHEIYFSQYGSVTTDSHTDRVALFWRCCATFTRSCFCAGVILDSHESVYYTLNALHENIAKGWVKQYNGTVPL